MSKTKISATVDPDVLARARAASDASSVSELIDEALALLVERRLEERWLGAHTGGDAASARGDDHLPGEVPVDLAHLPWDDPPAASVS